MGAAVLGVDLTERGNGGQGGTRPCTPSNCRRRTVPRGTIWLTTQSGLLISLDEHSSSVFCASGQRGWALVPIETCADQLAHAGCYGSRRRFKSFTCIVGLVRRRREERRVPHRGGYMPRQRRRRRSALHGSCLACARFVCLAELQVFWTCIRHLSGVGRAVRRVDMVDGRRCGGGHGGECPTAPTAAEGLSSNSNLC
jgi:hypothetical protein